jgi:hypothetical protein
VKRDYLLDINTNNKGGTIMKCICCDCILTDFEATRRNARTKEFLDICNSCFEPIKNEFTVVEREDLRNTVQVEDEDYVSD